MLLAKLAADAGLPAGVLNVVHGSRRAVDFICDAAEIRAISFVGGNVSAASRKALRRPERPSENVLHGHRGPDAGGQTHKAIC